jgi:UDP-2-acetamido-3-amino-2,3-dideoxy-glucuronate N-acetyltransferase
MTPAFAHPTAIVEATQIGEGTRIWAYTHVMCDVIVGTHCNIGEHCYLESGAIIGDQVTIKNGNMIWDGVRLADGVFVGPQVVFTNDLYPRSPRLRQATKRYADRGWLETTVIERGASIGAGAVILAGVTIGEFCMVGAGSIVTRSLPPYALAVGSPARIRGWVCQCGQRLPWSNGAASCVPCGLEFTCTGGLVSVVAESEDQAAAVRVRAAGSTWRAQGGA